MAYPLKHRVGAVCTQYAENLKLTIGKHVGSSLNAYCKRQLIYAFHFGEITKTYFNVNRWVLSFSNRRVSDAVIEVTGLKRQNS